MSVQTHLIYEDDNVKISDQINMNWSKEKISQATIKRLAEKRTLSLEDTRLVMQTVDILIDTIDRAYHTGYDEGIENLRAAVLAYKGIDLNYVAEISSEEQK